MGLLGLWDLFGEKKCKLATNVNSSLILTRAHSVPVLNSKKLKKGGKDD